MHCSTSDFHLLASFQHDPYVYKQKKGHISHSMLSLDSIYALKVPTYDLLLEFYSVSEIFPLIGKFFYFWPLLASKHYRVGGLKDFEFLSVDRFNMSLAFRYDYFSQRLRVSSQLRTITYDEAYGADANSEALIQSLSDRLCDGEYFEDEDSGERFIVVSVERNQDPGLVNAKKKKLRFNGIVAWTLPFQDKGISDKLLLECRQDRGLLDLHCVPMDPDDFDIERHIIPSDACCSTPAKKKKEKKDPDDFVPDVAWKPSASSSRGRRSSEMDATLRQFLHHRIACTDHFYEHPASKWLLSAIVNSLNPSSNVDIRIGIETCLEFASILDINEAFINVLDIDMEDRVDGRQKRDVYLKHCVNECVRVADGFKQSLC
jgi:hypothetical protein